MASNISGLVPVVALRKQPSNLRRYLVLFLPSVLGSVVFHVLLLAAFLGYLFLIAPAQADHVVERPTESLIQADEVEKRTETFSVLEEDPAALEPDTGIQHANDRRAEISVPGANHPSDLVGMKDGDKKNQPFNIPVPGGFGGDNQGGTDRFDTRGNSDAPGMPGGTPNGMPLHGTIFGRVGATREFALRTGGGTEKSEVAVARGLGWLVRQQLSDGRWMLNSPNLPDKDRGIESNDVAATALGLLPFLTAGKTHKPINENKYDKVVDRGLKFLLRSQDPKTGYFGASMYAHGLACIAMCEAYALSHDPVLRRPAQAAVNLLINSQHEGGGWRYGPTRQPGDLSISGWQMMALKSAQMAGLDVTTITINRAKSFLNRCSGPDEGYSYLPGSGTSPRMTAVGLLCRQYMDNWGPSHPRMIKAIQNQIKKNPPDRRDVYYYYYATQVMHHFGGEEWKAWNEKMREYLIKGQDARIQHANFGSWSAEGDQWGRSGGRLMMTSLNLLTLEVYYRYLPLYYRDAGYKRDATVQKAF